MPFTPSILDKKLKQYVNFNKKLNYSYMTSCVEATEQGKLHLKAAMHPGDYTVRPQKVSKTSCPKYYKLIEQFYKLTGIGAVLNTSLNMHEYPIVTNPKDIIEEIIKKTKNLNFSILIEDSFFKKRWESKKFYYFPFKVFRILSWFFLFPETKTSPCLKFVFPFQSVIIEPEFSIIDISGK